MIIHFQLFLRKDNQIFRIWQHFTSEFGGILLPNLAILFFLFCPMLKQ